MRALVVADEVDERLRACGVRTGVDVVLGAGDLPFDYLGFLADAANRPCVFVPGNHDPDLTGFRRSAGLWTRAGFPQAWPGPPGAVNADGRVVDIAGLRIAGLGGSVRYSGGPNQWTQAQQARRAKRLVRAAERRRRRDGRGVDVLLTHSPPRGVGDREDPPHHGFDCLLWMVERLAPKWLLHGHIHPYGEHLPEHRLGGTRVRNVVGSHVLDLDEVTV
ncbi:calcineurin-like phosphoesterase family protein [Amycolatopsis bartoniae]|uniref:Metallophosphoesterase n=1 Tax=Amycolatopsis bartoniae TaxID=941986 RepID=A0A8H9MG61_9PSEU|nr:metallophosphoesterase [Amycolatopsis bartoniae]MBB2937247.1 calcineurin-like phosphoesterase family protein [Amycolatopsis bartoniae]TVT07891.1 metallophosphoesterase [Amycolatopsis bartoniae]GHF77605.1 metallophosphoesterase [Amycolatopsis bartoniae]